MIVYHKKAKKQAFLFRKDYGLKKFSTFEYTDKALSPCFLRSTEELLFLCIFLSVIWILAVISFDRQQHNQVYVVI